MRPRGIPRGKRAAELRDEPGADASMRPRGIPRGKRTSPGSPSCGASRFNEAAGNTPRKTNTGRLVVQYVQPASMRPRGIPRGKLQIPTRHPLVPGCFNEAAGNTPRKTLPPETLVFSKSTLQ